MDWYYIAGFLWILIFTNSLHPSETRMNDTNVCGYIEITSPAIEDRDVTMTFVALNNTHNGEVKWERKGGSNPWSILPNNTEFIQKIMNGTYQLTVTSATPTDAIEYRVRYLIDDSSIQCTSKTVSLTLTVVASCGLIYLKSDKIIINETVELGYYSTLDIFKHPDSYVRSWYLNNQCLHGPGCENVNRVKFEEIPYPNKQYVLRIHNYSTSDEGAYSLRCTSGRSNDLYTDTVNITTPVPPSIPVLSPLSTIDGCNNCLVGEVGALTGVFCMTTGGTPPFTVRIRTVNSWNTLEQIGGNGTYRDSIQMTRQQHLTKIICAVSNFATKQPLTVEANIYVIVDSTPQLYTPTTLVEGEPVNITCVQPNIRPRAKNLTMSIGGEYINGINIQHDFNNTTYLYNSRISLMSFNRSWNKKDITCCVTSHNRNNCALSTSIEYMFPPESVTLQIDTNISQKSQYYTVNARCYINESNPACQATWEAPRAVVASNRTYNTGGSVTVIHLAKFDVTIEDNGRNVTCKPSCGTHFEDVPVRSWPILVPYAHPLEFNVSSSTLNVSKGSIVYVKCTCESHPPSTITWFDTKDNSTLLTCNDDIANALVPSYVISSTMRPDNGVNRITECTIPIDTRKTDGNTLDLLCQANHIFKPIIKRLTVRVIENTKPTDTPSNILAIAAGIGGGIVVVAICLTSVGITRCRRTKADSSPDKQDAIPNEYGDMAQNDDHREVVEAQPDDRDRNEHNLIYADLEFQDNVEPSDRSVVKRSESPVEYVGIDFVKSIELAKNTNGAPSSDEENIYMNQ